MKDNVHSGHRKRLRARYLKEGGENFEDHELLEMVLYNCIPVKDTNELAHKILNEFGSLSMLISSDPIDIMQRCSISENMAIFISIQNEWIKRIEKEKAGSRVFIDSSLKAGEYAKVLFKQVNYERFYVICLDSRHRLINSVLVSEGTVKETTVYPRTVVEVALRYQSSSVILAHNHPGGTTKPSLNDINTTVVIVKALNLIDIFVADHVIVVDNGYFSFAESGMLKNDM